MNYIWNLDKSVIIKLSLDFPRHMDSVEFLQNLGFKFSQDQVDKAARKDGPFIGMSEYVFRRWVARWI